MSTTAMPEESSSALSEGQRVLYTFTAPGKTMGDLRRNASWWVPWLLVSLVSVAFVFTLDKRIGWGQVLESQIQSNPVAAEKMDRMPPDQRANVMKIQEMSARVMGYAAPLTTLIVMVAVSGALLGLFNFGFGAKLRFGELMGVTAYSFLPSIFGTLLTIVLLFFVDPESFDLKNPVATNVGYFVPSTMPFLKSLLGVFDLFAIWQVFLLATGVSQLSKVKKGAAFGAIFGLFFAVRLISAAFSTMF